MSLSLSEISQVFFRASSGHTEQPGTGVIAGWRGKGRRSSRQGSVSGEGDLGTPAGSEDKLQDYDSSSARMLKGSSSKLAELSLADTPESQALELRRSVSEKAEKDREEGPTWRSLLSPRGGAWDVLRRRRPRRTMSVPEMSKIEEDSPPSLQDVGIGWSTSAGSRRRGEQQQCGRGMGRSGSKRVERAGSEAEATIHAFGTESKRLWDFCHVAEDSCAVPVNTAGTSMQWAPHETPRPQDRKSASVRQPKHQNLRIQVPVLDSPLGSSTGPVSAPARISEAASANQARPRRSSSAKHGSLASADAARRQHPGEQIPDVVGAPASLPSQPRGSTPVVASAGGWASDRPATGGSLGRPRQLQSWSSRDRSFSRHQHRSPSGDNKHKGSFLQEASRIGTDSRWNEALIPDLQSGEGSGVSKSEPRILRSVSSTGTVRRGLLGQGTQARKSGWVVGKDKDISLSSKSLGDSTIKETDLDQRRKPRDKPREADAPNTPRGAIASTRPKKWRAGQEMGHLSLQSKGVRSSAREKHPATPRKLTQKEPQGGVFGEGSETSGPVPATPGPAGPTSALSRKLTPRAEVIQEFETAFLSVQGTQQSLPGTLGPSGVPEVPGVLTASGGGASLTPPAGCATLWEEGLSAASGAVVEGMELERTDSTESYIPLAWPLDAGDTFPGTLATSGVPHEPGVLTESGAGGTIGPPAAFATWWGKDLVGFSGASGALMKDLELDDTDSTDSNIPLAWPLFAGDTCSLSNLHALRVSSMSSVGNQRGQDGRAVTGHVDASVPALGLTRSASHSLPFGDVSNTHWHRMSTPRQHGRRSQDWADGELWSAGSKGVPRFELRGMMTPRGRKVRFSEVVETRIFRRGKAHSGSVETRVSAMTRKRGQGRDEAKGDRTIDEKLGKQSTCT